MFEGVTDVSANGQVLTLADETLHGISHILRSVSVIQYPILQVKAVQEESIDFIMEILRVFFMRRAFINSLESLIPPVHTFKLLLVFLQNIALSDYLPLVQRHCGNYER